MLPSCYRSRLAGTVILMLFALLHGFAQSTAPALQIEAKAVYSDSVVIVRWAPANLATWKWGNSEGYDLIRFTVIDQGDTLNGAQYDSSMVSLAAALKPLPENEWDPLVDENDLAGVAAGSIYGDSLDLLPPDGPNLLNIYYKGQESENRFSFSLFAADQDFTVATMMGLAFVDYSTTPGSRYIYWVKPHDPDSLATVRPGFTSVQTDSLFVLPAPSELRGTAGDHSAVLNWRRNDQYFTSYILERSDDGINFLPRNERPLISAAAPDTDDGAIAFVDSLYANGVTFIYRVRGRSPFGLLSNPSDTVQVSGKPGPVFALLSIEDIGEIQEGELQVRWNFPQDMESKFLSFDIYRGASPEGPFVKLNQTTLTVSERSFIDTDPQAVNYYQVRTTDENGYPLHCFPRLGQTRDNTPPSAPAAVFGQADASGVVTLHWLRSPESDVMGYRVFMANARDGDYAQVTSVWLNDTVFRYQINLNTLSEYVFFGVKALDFHHNQSPMSAPAEIARPDIIPPAAPLITSVQATPHGVEFSWTGSSSPDVVRHEFQRKAKGLPGWTVLVEVTKLNPISGFIDSTASKKRWYQYRLVAVDEAGNRGGSRIVQAKPINDGLRDDLLNLSGQLVAGPPEMVLLEWEYPKDPDLIGFQIYRGYDSSAMFAYRFFPYPVPASGDYADMSMYSNGPVLHFRFSDYDVQFDERPILNYSYIYDSALNTNLAVPPPQGAPAQGSLQNYTMPHPVLAHPQTLRYWVLAKFADGSWSPLAGPLAIDL